VEQSLKLLRRILCNQRKLEHSPRPLRVQVPAAVHVQGPSIPHKPAVGPPRNKTLGAVLLRRRPEHVAAGGQRGRVVEDGLDVEK
jgi:hypothetical protein